MKFTKLTKDSDVRDLIEYHNGDKENGYVVLDLETTGLDPFNDRITDFILTGFEQDEAILCPGSSVSVLSHLNKPLVCHNFKFDFNMCYRNGVDLRNTGLHADTLLLDHLLDENLPHGLGDIVQRRYRDTYKDQFWAKYKHYTDASVEDQLEYACKDVVYTGMIYRALVNDLTAAGIPTSLIKHVHSLALCLYDTEITGIKLDLPYLEGISRDLTTKIAAVKGKMRSLVDLECQQIENLEYLKELEKRKTDKGKSNVKRPQFNFDSSLQLGKLLYDNLKLAPQFNKDGNRTADDAALEKLEDSHGVVSHLRQYRGDQKLFTAFIEGSLQKMRADRIYPSFNVNGTVTGRISSSSPNMQQLPKEGGIRGIYIPNPGNKFISCDYAQLEVTLAAHFSRDKNLLKIVYEGASQHDITAEGLKIDRKTAKTINFALQYGAGVHKIQKILACSAEEADKALKAYWETYSGLAEFIKHCHSRVDKGIPLINPFGRQRRFNIQGRSFWEKAKAKRQAANAIIQGTGADITNRAFYLVGEILRKTDMGNALFPIHDELLISVNENYIQEASEILTKTMIGVGKEIGLTVPLAVSCSKPMARWGTE